MPKCAGEHPSNEVTQLSIDAANVSLLFLTYLVGVLYSSESGREAHEFLFTIV